MGKGDFSEQARENPDLAKKRLLKAKPEPYQLTGVEAFQSERGAGGIGGIGEIIGENRPNPPFHPIPLTQAAVLPKNSILQEFYDLALTITEGADCYIIGAILPVAAASLARNVWYPWGAERLYPNLYSMLAGKPGDRKTATIDLAEVIAQKALSKEAFLPKSFSPETLFDEYDAEAGGQPDKVLICDDANAILTDFQQSAVGARNAALFLSLYDCKGLSESYRRNRIEKKAETQRRFIPGTSTSVLFGATFNACQFRNQAVRIGLQRRFMYYVSEKHGRFIKRPNPRPNEMNQLASRFALLTELKGPFRLTTGADTLFSDNYQSENRKQLDTADRLDEALCSRLSTAPIHVLKVAMVFEACRSIHAGSKNLEIQEHTMELAIEHIEECLKASSRLEGICRKVYIENDAEILLSRIRADFAATAKNGAIILSRTEITSKYANHGHRGAQNVRHIYTHIIPELISQGQATLLQKDGKLERYAFRAS